MAFLVPMGLSGLASLSGNAAAHIFSQSAGPRVRSWANWWAGKDKIVELRHLRDADAMHDFDVATDHLKNAAVAEDRSEDQMRQLLAAEKALIEARQKLKTWEGFTREEETSLFPVLVKCHHLLICTTYWVASEGGVKKQAGLKRAWVVVDDLVKLISDKETQALQDAERARAGWLATQSMLEQRAQMALKPVQGLYQQNVLPYIDQLNSLEGTAVLHSIAWRNDRDTGHVCEALVQWDKGGPEEMIGNTSPMVKAIAGASADASAVMGAGEGAEDATGGGGGGAARPRQTSDGVSTLADTLGSEPEPEPEPGAQAPERTSSTPDEKLQHALASLKTLSEMGEDTATIEAEIAGLRGEIAMLAVDPTSSMRSTAGDLEDIKRKLKEDLDRERAERAAQEKAGRASSRRRDDNARWLWASGAPDGSDGKWKPFGQVVVDVLEGAWAEGEAEQSIYPQQSMLDGTEGPEYIVDMIQMIQFQASDRSRQRRVRRDGAEQEPEAEAEREAESEEGIPPAAATAGR
jgi:hypothetical protein